MKHPPRFSLLLMFFLSACSQSIPKSCLDDDAFPKPKNLCPSYAVSAANIKPVDETKKQAGYDKLTISDVLLKLIETNPDIGIAGAKEKEQTAAIETAKAAGRPTVDASVSAGPQHIFWPMPGGDAVRKEASLNVRQVLYDFGAIENDVHRAEMAYASSASSRVAKTEEIAFEMLKAYLKVEQTDDQIRITRENIAAHQDILNLVQLREEIGSGTVADVKRITTRLESTKTALIDLTTQRADAAAAFENLTAIKPENVDAKLLKSLEGRPELIDASVLEANPSIVALQRDLASLEYQLASAEAEKLPSIGLQGTVRASQNVSSADAGDDQLAIYGLVTMRLPILDGGMNKSKQDQIKSRIEVARLKLEKQRRSLWEDTQNAMRVASTDDTKSGSLEARVAAAKKVADLNLEQFRNGSKSVFELLDGQADYFKARGDLVGQTYSHMQAQARALLLRGKLVRAILGLPLNHDAPILSGEPSYKSMREVEGLPGVRVEL